MKYIKTIIGGIVVKSIRLQVLLDLKAYLELITEAKRMKIEAKNDSQLIQKVIAVFINEIPIIQLENERLKAAVAQKNVLIQDLEAKIDEIKSKQGKKK
jgi:regulator of replication initiation timing